MHYRLYHYFAYRYYFLFFFFFFLYFFIFLFFFFFSSRRRHTRFDCDWSSDVCSSDLDPTRIPVSRERSVKNFSRRNSPESFRSRPSLEDRLSEQLPAPAGKHRSMPFCIGRILVQRIVSHAHAFPTVAPRHCRKHRWQGLGRLLQRLKPVKRQPPEQVTKPGERVRRWRPLTLEA